MANSNDIPDGYKVTELGVLPEEWNTVPFSSCFIKKKGKIPSHINTSDFQITGKYPIIDQSINTIAGYTDDETKLFKEPLPVIIFGDHTRIFKFVDFSFAIGAQGTKTFIPNKKLFDPEFLYYNLSNLEIPNRGYNRHSKILSEYSIVQPPIQEQHAIATDLRTVQEAKEKTDEVIAATKTLKAAMMKHLFTYGPVPPEDAERVALKETEIGQVPEEWDVVKLGEVSEFLQYGTSKKCDYDVKGYPVLRIPNIVNGIIDSTDLKFLDATIDDFNKIQLKIGDILFVRTNGVRNLVGRCATYQGDPENSLFASYLIRVRLKSDRALPAFVQYYAETPSGREFLSGQASGSADGKFNINTQTIKSVVLPLPDVTVQKRIVDIISSIDQKLAAEQSRKEALVTLFASLLHDLMTAKVRVCTA